jgi:O-antigen/teichoic acid export membrane protein
LQVTAGDWTSHPAYGKARRVFGMALRWRSRAGAWAFVALLFSVVFTIYNFTMALLMPLSDFGLFSYGQSLILLVGIFIATLVTEPSMIVGARYTESEELRYLTFSLVATIAVGLVTAVPAAMIFTFSQNADFATPLAIAALASPLMQSFHVGRRYLYLRERFGFLIWLGVAHAVLLLLAPAIFYLTGTASPSAALAATGIAGAIPTFGMIIRLRLWQQVPSRDDVVRYSRDHWAYARWTLAAAGPHWLSTNGIVAVTVWLFSLDVGSVYRMCQLIVSPILQVSQVLSQIFLPFVAQRAHAQPKAYLAGIQRKAFWLYLGIGLASTAAVLAVMPLLIDRLIPEKMHHESIAILVCLLIGTFFDVLRSGQGITVSAAGRTKFLFLSATASTIVMYALALPLIYVTGIAAVAAGFAAGRILRYGLVHILLRRWIATHPSDTV